MPIQADSVPAESSEKFIGAAEWLPIETAPEDGRQFLVLQDGEIYQAKFNHGRMGFRIHRLRTASKYRIVDAEMDGHAVKAQVPVDEPWAETFKHDWCIWTRGFEFNPTHWMPLPSPPGAELNFSNEPERSAVSLNSDNTTSSKQSGGQG